MRFPLRLTADLAKAKIVRMGRAGAARPMILRVTAPADAGEEGSSTSITNSAADEAILSQVKASGAPIVWIGGSVDPLAYDGVGHLTRQIADLAKTVFLETDGVLLRRRIFSFRPVAHTFLTVQLNGTEGFHDRHAQREGIYRAAIEGIRAARLSGFMICAKTAMFDDTDACELEGLRKTIEELELDGWVVTRGAGVAESVAIRKTIEASRKMSGGRWAAFSKMVEASEQMAGATTPAAGRILPGEEQGEESFEQEVRVP
jgi:hypothetical protein